MTYTSPIVKHDDQRFAVHFVHSSHVLLRFPCVLLRLAENRLQHRFPIVALRVGRSHCSERYRSCRVLGHQPDVHRWLFPQSEENPNCTFRLFPVNEASATYVCGPKRPLNANNNREIDLCTRRHGSQQLDMLTRLPSLCTRKNRFDYVRLNT